MATSQEDKKQEVEDELYAPLDAIAHLATHDTERFFDEAVNARIISAEVRKKIDATMKNHMLLFQRNIAVERGNKVNEKLAVRRAFKITYGKFLLEDDNELKRPDSFFMRTLSRVLKFPIDNRLGIKGRTELEAAAARLRMLRSPEYIDSYVSDAYMDVSIEKADVERDKQSIDEKILSLDLVKKDFSDIASVPDVDKSLNTLDELEKLRAEYTDSLNKLNDSSALQDYLEKALSLRWSVEDLRDSLQNDVKKAGKANGVASLVERLSVLISDFDDLRDRKNLDPPAFLNFLDSLKSVLNSVASMPSLGDSTKKLVSMCRKLLTDIERNSPVRDMAQISESLSATISKIPDESDSLKESIDNLVDNVKTFMSDVEKEYGALPANVRDEILSECSQYLKAYSAFSTPTLKHENFRAFIENVFIPFRGRIYEIIDKPLTELRSQSLQNSKNLFAIDDKLHHLQAFTPALSSSPFPPGVAFDIETLETELSELEHRKNSLTEERDTLLEYQTLSGKLKILQDDLHDSQLKMHKTLSDLSKVAEKTQQLHTGDHPLRHIIELHAKAIAKLENEFKSVSVLLSRQTLDSPAFKRFYSERKALAEELGDAKSALAQAHTILKGHVKKLANRGHMLARSKKRLEGDLAKLESEVEQAALNLQKFIETLDQVPTFNYEIRIPEIASEINELDSGIQERRTRLSTFKGLPLDEMMLLEAFPATASRLLLESSDSADAAAGAESESNLTDAQASKKIFGAIVAQMYPDLTLEEQIKIASAMLADDVQTIQTEEDYEELAEKHHAELLETVDSVGFRGRLINFKYKLDDKEYHPFKGLTPEDFASAKRLKELFKVGKLNHQNGFFALAAFELFAEEDKTGKSGQVFELRKLLRKALAEEMGIDKRLDEAGVNRILDDAFNEQVEKVAPIVKEHFKMHHDNLKDWQRNKVEELQLRFGALNEQMKLGKITPHNYKLKSEQLYEDARGYDVADRFTQSSAVSEFWNSKHAQWLRDKGYEIGSYSTRKLKAGIFEGTALYLRGIWGGTKLAVSTAAHGVAKVPLSIVKNTGLLAVSPIKWVVNLKRRTQNLVNRSRNWFRKRKGKELKEMREYWTPFSVGQSVKNDLGRVGVFTKEKALATGAGIKGAFGKVGAFWSKEAWKEKNYANRTTVDTAFLESQADELAKDGLGEPREVSSSPFIDIDKYRVQLQKLDEMTGIEAAAA